MSKLSYLGERSKPRENARASGKPARGRGKSLLSLPRPRFRVSSRASTFHDIPKWRAGSQASVHGTPRGLAVRRTQPGLIFSDARWVRLSSLHCQTITLRMSCMFYAQAISRAIFCCDFVAILWRFLSDFICCDFQSLCSSLLT